MTRRPPAPEVAHHRARIANATQRGDRKAVELSQRDLAVAKLAVHIEKVVAAAPPVTPEQRNRLASLLMPGGGGDA